MTLTDIADQELLVTRFPVKQLALKHFGTKNLAKFF